jgi:2,4-dienoyl-CoA reductase (NADPH2)
LKEGFVFEHLLQPGRIGKITTKNRIRFAPQITNMCDPKTGEVTEQEINYLVEKAKGGAGIVTAQGGYVQPLGKGYPRQMAMDRDENIPGLTRLAKAIKDHGALAMSQVMHVGRLAHPKYAGLDEMPVGPTAMEPMIPRFEPCREINKEEIKEIVELHGDAARRGKEAGFEAVDICGINGYFIHSFLCAWSNQRTDEYGGSVENRARVCVEIIEAVRRAVGPDYPILLRLNATDLKNGGSTEEEYTRIALMCQEAGVDALSAAVGMYESDFPAITSDIKPGQWLYLAENWKKAGVKVPIMMAYRMSRAEVAEKAVADGIIDFWEMMRPLMADPYIPQKLVEGRPEDIALCVACNYGCFVPGEAKQACTMNPRFGKEGDESLLIKPAKEKRKIMVAGGGPAGMEAARVAALRAHDVTLYEMGGELGGQLNLLATTPNWDEWADVAKYFITQVQKAGVKVELGKEVTAELVQKEKPDRVIVATGPILEPPEVPGINGKNVVSVFDVLAEKVTVGKRVAVWGGRHFAVYAADKLAAQGKEVILATDLPKWGRGISPTIIIGYKIRFRMIGIHAMREATLERISDTGIVVTHKGEEKAFEVDTVVIATVERNRQLAEELGVEKDFIAGDCRAPRRVFSAVHEGYSAGLKA